MMLPVCCVTWPCNILAGELNDTYEGKAKTVKELGLYTVSKVSDSIGIIKSIPVSVSKRQINNTFNDTFHNDINNHIKAILTQKWIFFFKYLCSVPV